VATLRGIIGAELRPSLVLDRVVRPAGFNSAATLVVTSSWVARRVASTAELESLLDRS